MSAKLAITDLLPLPNSTVKIPQLGFGIYLSPPELCHQSCLTALRSGYRHIDSAQIYGNEVEMGTAARESGIPRKDLFLTTKILSAGGSPEKTYQKLLDSVKKICGDDEEGYVDLFLIHTPSGGPAARKEMWQALERLESEGKTKAIGVSNHGVGHIEEMKQYARIWPPHINQIEVRLLSFLDHSHELNCVDCARSSSESTTFAHLPSLHFASTLTRKFLLLKLQNGRCNPKASLPCFTQSRNDIVVSFEYFPTFSGF